LKVYPQRHTLNIPIFCRSWHGRDAGDAGKHACDERALLAPGGHRRQHPYQGQDPRQREHVGGGGRGLVDRSPAQGSRRAPSLRHCCAGDAPRGRARLLCKGLSTLCCALVCSVHCAAGAPCPVRLRPRECVCDDAEAGAQLKETKDLKERRIRLILLGRMLEVFAASACPRRASHPPLPFGPRRRPPSVRGSPFLHLCKPWH
jgi:hypothetical protein